MEDAALLQRPARPEFLDTDPWRSLRILSEFVEGFDALAAVGPAVSVFGSARTKPDHRYYGMARELGAMLGKQGYAVITGGRLIDKQRLAQMLSAVESAYRM